MHGLVEWWLCVDTICSHSLIEKNKLFFFKLRTIFPREDVQRFTWVRLVMWLNFGADSIPSIQLSCNCGTRQARRSLVRAVAVSGPIFRAAAEEGTRQTQRYWRPVMTIEICFSCVCLTIGSKNLAIMKS